MLKGRVISQAVSFTDLYATTHFNSDPALLVNVEQQLSTSLGDLTPAHGSFPNNSTLGDSLRTLLLPTVTSENRESLTKGSLSPSRRGFKRKDNLLATLNPKIGFQDATGSEASIGLFACTRNTSDPRPQWGSVGGGSDSDQGYYKFKGIFGGQWLILPGQSLSFFCPWESYSPSAAFSHFHHSETFPNLLPEHKYCRDIL